MNDFPSLPERDLPEGRRHLLKEHLLNETRGETQQEEAPPDPRRRGPPPPSAGPARAGALALAVVGGIALAGGDGGAGGTPGTPGAKDTGVAADGPAPKTAAQLLDRVATVASEQDAGTVRDDQYAYIKTKAAWGESEMCEPLELGPVKTREAWIPVDGSGPLVFRTDGGPVEAGETPTPGIPSNTYYRHFESLPTDPAKMLDWLYKATEGGNSLKPGGKTVDHNAFRLVGDLVNESLIPPKTAAALYRAAAKIPGVELVPDATDAVGRKGIAVGRVDEASGLRAELVFDAKSYAFLGERGVLTKDGDGGSVTEPDGTEKQCPGTPAGTVTANTAVLGRSVVDTAPKADPSTDKKRRPTGKPVQKS
ncbi:CU044_5270 family protein [Streptomyces sp. N35]|uniref:CU044_5270 family protein n=1 Tax=Streptomyces sp. N35 TaxID=2795730 RepID=UPI0018F2A650|nr:CU044_5270 family protein [Streptomyces sp. N35]